MSLHLKMDAQRRQLIRLAPAGLLWRWGSWGSALSLFARPALANDRLPRAESWAPTLAQGARAGQPVMVLWGTPGCPWCAALRAEVIIHVWREASQRGVQVFEFDLTDRTPLRQQPEVSPAALARQLGIRVSPTVSFHGPGGELAERLVGYASRDFYPAYLDERLAQARTRLKGA